MLITARMGSARLPEKHLRPISGRPALAHLLDRVEREFHAEIDSGVVLSLVATGNEVRNARLAALCLGRRTNVFFGDDDNIPLRHLQASEALELDAIVSVDGDDLFCAPEAMRHVFELLSLGIGLAKATGLPLGMNSWGYSHAALAAALRGVSPSLLETGWGRIFTNVTDERVVALPCPRADEVRATLDYDKDLAFFTRSICEIPDWHELATVDFVREIIERGIHHENASLNDQYWENFSLHVSKEIEGSK